MFDALLLPSFGGPVLLHYVAPCSGTNGPVTRPRQVNFARVGAGGKQCRHCGSCMGLVRKSSCCPGGRLGGGVWGFSTCRARWPVFASLGWSGFAG
eukprot:8709297-Alexandrium_andersonii.AAC.1